jgi:hypothetical protein
MQPASNDEWESFKTNPQEAYKDSEQAFGNLQQTFKQTASRIN